MPSQAQSAYCSLSLPRLEKKTCTCMPHLDMILFSFSMKRKTTTTKARKRAYLLLILRLCRKSRQSWGEASPFSMGKGGAVGTRLRAIAQGLAPCPQVGGTLVLWKDRLLVDEKEESFPTRLWRKPCPNGLFPKET